MNPNVDLIGDPTRRCILTLLVVEGDVCVCEIVAEFEEIQPSVSRHLRMLRAGGWITSRREGMRLQYRPARRPTWAQTLLEARMSVGVAPDVLRDARRRLAAFSGRPEPTPAIRKRSSVWRSQPFHDIRWCISRLFSRRSFSCRCCFSLPGSC
jgi:ArsR family transcriptional regulator